jgi:HAD superfamily hydrolase (TIGR01509 family)
MFCFNNVQGIIFDLDDTLVHAKLDFVSMKREIGCQPEHDILTFIDGLSCAKSKALAQNIVLQHELEDAKSSQLIKGALDFILRARQHALPLAIVTRNCRQAVAIKLKRNNIPIDLVLTREDALPKPHPEALLAIATQWRLPPANIAYIGDYIYDIQAAHNAKMQAWLFQHCSKNELYEAGLQHIPVP